MAAAFVDSEDTWRECASWLTRCKVLPADHRATWSTAGIADLANFLRDGVLLCNLLHNLDADSIDFKNVNKKPQMAQFLCTRNIETFLASCKNFFELREADLFEPLMLFDLSNFHRVLCTLSKLSNCPKVQKKNIPGFAIKRTKSQEDLYQSLSSLELGPRRQTHLEDQDEYTTYCAQKKEEEIYQEVFHLKQNLASSLCAPVGSQGFEKREYVIKELVETEQKYVELLTKLVKYFMTPLSQHIKKEDMDIIFHGVRDLADIHTGFCGKLINACYGQTFPRKRLSDVFLEWREKFLAYGTYCANLLRAQTLLQDICDRDETVNQEVMKCQENYKEGKFKLRDVLSVPMQRILKYHLLLQKLIEETQPSHSEYQALKRAREAMVDVATYINEVKRDTDHLQLLQQVQENITNWKIDAPIHTYGRLQSDGDLKIKSHDDQKIRNRYAFILDKIILLCKPKGNQYIFRESILLQDFHVDDVSNRPILNHSARWSYQWLLVKTNPQTVYTLYARTIDLKKKMIKAIQDALDNFDPPGSKNTNHRFEMHTFEKHETCNRCSKFLRGLIFQGYMCRICGIAVHKECISQSGRCGAPPPLPSPDEALREKLWFGGEMKRETADSMLLERQVGTYLLRISPRCEEKMFVVSLRTRDNVRHMKIHRKDELYYLSESRFFRSILHLVQFYESHSLREIFERLDADAKLLWPYRQIIAVVLSEFIPDDNNQLRLEPGTKVAIISKDGGPSEDWYKGKCRNVVGYFPKSHVEEVDEITCEPDH